MPDVAITFSDLEAAASSLGTIIDEFENATSRSEDLEADIGDPFDKSELRDQACDFEERWDDKRDELKESLEGVKKHIDDVVSGFKGGDNDMAVAFTAKG
ncbi:flagellar protein FlgN [Nocardioides sp. NPDC127503]|uniref:flagellar protein FlgN n=1 Tax=Nocardioides sp. NPDC127503 TaxID=3154516 RepID=UPI003323EBB1